MKVARVWRACLAVALCSSVSRFARATPAAENTAQGQAEAPPSPSSTPGVVIIASPPDAPAVPLLRAELRAAGVKVMDALEPGAAGLSLRVVFARESLEVSVVDEVTGRTTLHELFSQTNGDPMDARTAVLHAVELLHWHLSPHQTSAAPSARPRSEITRAPEPKEIPQLVAAALPFASYSPGGTTMALGAQLDLLCHWREFGLRALGATLLTSARIERAEGSIDVTSRWLGLEAVWLSRETRFGSSLQLAGGATLLGLRLNGTPNAGAVGGKDTLLTPGALVDLRARQRLARPVALTLGASAQLPLTSDRLRMLDREIGRYGQLLMTLGLGLEVRLL